MRSLTVCRVLVVPRPAYVALAQDFPMSATSVLENLQKNAEMVRAGWLFFFQETSGTHQPSHWHLSVEAHDYNVSNLMHAHHTPLPCPAIGRW